MTPPSLPGREELGHWLWEHMSPWVSESKCEVVATHLLEFLSARLRPAWPRLTNEAHDAISVEHERDHTDGPNLPREGCLGCRMIAEIDALREQVAACVAALTAAIHFDISATFDAKGSYTERKSKEWWDIRNRCEAALARATHDPLV